MSQTKKHCEPLVAVWLRPSTTESCICCKQVAEKPRGEHLKNDVLYILSPFMLITLQHQLSTRMARLDGQFIFAVFPGLSRTSKASFTRYLLDKCSTVC